MFKYEASKRQKKERFWAKSSYVNIITIMRHIYPKIIQE